MLPRVRPTRIRTLFLCDAIATKRAIEMIGHVSSFRQGARLLLELGLVRVDLMSEAFLDCRVLLSRLAAVLNSTDVGEEVTHDVFPENDPLVFHLELSKKLLTANLDAASLGRSYCRFHN